MQRLIDKILDEATVIDNRIVKVDHFINHMLDTDLLYEIGKEFKEVFGQATKILTVETSGIAYAVSTAFQMGNIPVVFAKKTKSLITGENYYGTDVFSFTKEKMRHIIVDKEFLTADDEVLIIDDFLAIGNALQGLLELCDQAGAKVVGAGIVIEKGFQNARERFVDRNLKIHSLANIRSIKNNKVVF